MLCLHRQVRAVLPSGRLQLVRPLLGAGLASVEWFLLACTGILKCVRCLSIHKVCTACYSIRCCKLGHPEC